MLSNKQARAIFATVNSEQAGTQAQRNALEAYVGLFESVPYAYVAMRRYFARLLIAYTKRNFQCKY